MISASAVGYLPLFGGIGRVYTDLVAMVFCPIFVMRGRRKRSVVRNRPGLSLPRFGVVLSPDGERCNRCFARTRNKGCRRHRAGTQPFPWIDIRDLCRAMASLLKMKS